MEMNGKPVEGATGRPLTPIEQMFGGADKIPRCNTCPNFKPGSGSELPHEVHIYRDGCKRDPVTVDTYPENYCASHPFHAAAHMRVLNAIMRHAEQVSPTLSSRIIKPGT